MDDNADYREIFGRNPEPWRQWLGALRLTMTDDDVNLDRARWELDELIKVLNEKPKTVQRLGFGPDGKRTY